MLPTRRNKDSLSPTQPKKTKNPLISSRTVYKVLKSYNSSMHQKVFNKKELSIGKTIYISSIQKDELPKTLQAYYSLGMTKSNSGTFSLGKLSENSFDISEYHQNKNKKVKCEGICGKSYHASCFKTFFHENQRKSLCPECAEHLFFNSS